jgi:hypothetical protein
LPRAAEVEGPRIDPKQPAFRIAYEPLGKDCFEIAVLDDIRDGVFNLGVDIIRA